jgi:hypothetical protein
MARKVRTHPFAAHSARLMQSTYRSIAGGLVPPALAGPGAPESMVDRDGLTGLLAAMRALALGSESRAPVSEGRSFLDAAQAMLDAAQARVGASESRLDLGLSTALAHAYAPSAEEDWCGVDGHFDEFGFDLG